MEITVYGKCQRNHVARLGLFATDGCREYYPIPDAEHTLFCGACGCHRNFHEKKTVVHQQQQAPPPPQLATNGGMLPNGGSHNGDPREVRDLVVLESDEEHGTHEVEGPPPPIRTTRIRFTKQQNIEMVRFAEGLGWSLRNRRRFPVDEVKFFCERLGVEQRKFKNWFSNSRKKYLQRVESSLRAKDQAQIHA